MKFFEHIREWNKDEVLDAYSKGKSPSEIMREGNLKPSTVAQYLGKERIQALNTIAR